MIIGHQKIKDFFARAIIADKLAQAYIFSGPESVGKFTLAFDLAGRLTGNKDNKVNPDVIIVAPQEAGEIKIADIRELQRKLNLSSYGGKYKVAIIDKAGKMNLAAQNALLKTLEEPPEKVILILVTQNPDELLPTIVSRCQNKKFGLVSDVEMKKVIPEDLDNNKEEVLFWSLGCPGLAVKLVNNPDDMKQKKEALSELERLFSQNITEKMTLAEDVSQSPELLDKMNWWLVALRNNLIFGNSKFSLVSKEKNLGLIDGICSGIKIIQGTNSNPRLVLENLFLEF